MLVSESEIFTAGGRQRRWSAAKKLRAVDESLDDRSGVSLVARRKGVAKNPGLERSNLIDRLDGMSSPWRPEHKAQDGAWSNAMRSGETANVVPLINSLVPTRPTYG